MNLIRLIVIALVFWLLFRMVQRMLTKPGTEKPSPPKVGTDMVRCAHCGIHIPKNEALRRDGYDYCSEEHRQAGPHRD